MNPSDVTLPEFMNALFPPDMLDEDEHVILCRAMPDKDVPGHIIFPAQLWSPRSRANDATHACVATFGNTVSVTGRPSRTRDNVKAVWVLQLDDVGTKSKVPPIMPSAIIETKPGNQTWLFLLDEPCEDVTRFVKVTESLSAAGYGDENCTDATRLFRLPGSMPAGKEHAAKVIYWEPSAVFALDGILDLFKVREVEVAPRSTHTPLPAPPGAIIDDEVLDWLRDEGHALKQEHDGWWQITCPWAAEHSDARAIAKYKPATEADLRRVFHCHHTHGAEDRTEAFLKWVQEAGGPRAQVIMQARTLDRLAKALGIVKEAAEAVAEAWGTVEEPPRRRGRKKTAEAVLEELMEYLVWSPGETKPIRDLRQGAYGYPATTERGMIGALGGWRVPSVTPTGRPTTIHVLQAWLGAVEKKIATLPPMIDPRLAPGWTGTFINTYEPYPGGEYVPSDVEPFLRLVRHVAPDDSAYLLDWMAYKVQHPWERMVAVISYTPVFGTGRNALMHIMRLCLGDRNCAHMSASRLFGEKQNQFNSHMDNLLVTVGEVDEGAATSDRRISDRVFTRLKDMVDPNETTVMIERKGLEPVRVEMFTSFMMATNAGAGLPLDEGDRRFSVLRGADTPLMDVHPDLTATGGWLARIRDLREVRLINAVHGFLMERDVSAFKPNVPRNTTAKDAMIEARKNDIDYAIEEVLGTHTVFTVARLTEAVMALPDIRVNNDRKDIARQVRGWAMRMSEPPAWITTKQKRLMIREISDSGVFPRVLHGHQNKGEVIHRAALIEFLTGVRPVHASNVIDFRKEKEDDDDE